MRKDIEDLAVKLDSMADRANEVAGIQASASLRDDSSVSYWCGYRVACREAAEMVRKLKEDIT